MVFASLALFCLKFKLVNTALEKAWLINSRLEKILELYPLPACLHGEMRQLTEIQHLNRSSFIPRFFVIQNHFQVLKLKKGIYPFSHSKLCKYVDCLCPSGKKAFLGRIWGGESLYHSESPLCPPWGVGGGGFPENLYFCKGPYYID